jgi:hypothetical protein
LLCGGRAPVGQREGDGVCDLLADLVATIGSDYQLKQDAAFELFD